MAREYLCLQCRTALDEHNCPGRPRHTVASVKTDGGREDIRRTVWGPESLRRQAKRAAVAGGVGGGATIADGCIGCAHAAEGGLEGLIVVLAIAAVAGVFWLLFRGGRALRRHLNRPIANGADQRPAPLGPVVATGTIRATEAFASPLSMDECAAYGMELATTRWFRRYPMYRDGEIGACRLELDDGRVVDIPAGRCVVDLRQATPDSAYFDPARRFLAKLNAEPGQTKYRLVPFDTASLVLLRDGDRVTLHTPLQDVLDPTAPHTGGYRDAAPTRLSLAGTPRLRLLRDK